MKIELEMTATLEEQITSLVLKATTDALGALKKRAEQNEEWMDLQTGAKYAKVSYKTFIKFRQLGLQVCEIDKIKRVSKSEIDRFLNGNAF